MSMTSIPVYTCDRCGHTETITHPGNLYPWAVVFARQCNGPFRIGEDSANGRAPKGADLCPTCTASLKQWWEVEAA